MKYKICDLPFLLWNVVYIFGMNTYIITVVNIAIIRINIIIISSSTSSNIIITSSCSMIIEIHERS